MRENTKIPSIMRAPIHKQRKRILLATKHQSDTTSFLRAWGPFTHDSMRDIVEPIRVPTYPNWEYDWTNYWGNDIVYLHRPADPQSLHILERAKLLGIPVWIDMDDDLANVDIWNPAYRSYASESVQKTIDYCVDEADVVSVGGLSHWKRLTEKHKREIHLIPNNLDDRLLSLKKKHSRERKAVMWRGSDSHIIDLVTFQDEIEKLQQNTAAWDFLYFGFCPPIPKIKNCKNAKFIQTMNLFEFYSTMVSFNAPIHMVPLIETEFNRVKSNLAWSDATLAGSAVVGPAFGEYLRPGIINYSSPQEFYHILKNLISGDINSQAYHDESWAWICDNILTSIINKKRIEIINNL